MTRIRSIGVAAAAALALSVPAAPSNAQLNEPAVPAQPAPPKLDPRACSDRDRLTRSDIVETEGRAPVEGNLSDTLARTDGVICPPPGIDPHIRAPAPPTASDMPVIPPPGSPGGNPDIRPK